MFTELFSIVAPVYICAGLGWAWIRSGRAYDSDVVSDLVMTIGAPCLVFSSLVTLEVEGDALVEMGVATVLALLVMGIVAAGVLRAFGQPLTTFLAPMVLPNVGNMGLPICLFAFGEEGLALGIVVFAICSSTQFTVGMWLWTGQASLQKLYQTPVTVAVVAAAVVIATDVDVPEFALRTTRLLGGFTIPLLQFTLGVSIARLRLDQVPKTFALACFRMVLGLAVGVGVAAGLGLEGISRGVLILDCAMPVAVFNYMLAERYGRSPTEVASTVVLSTLISFVTLPILLAWIL